MTAHQERIEGVVLDEGLTVTLTELIRICGSSGRMVQLMVTEGLLSPHGRGPDEWRFSGLEVRRARRALRLKRDLDLNLAGVALALDLLDEIESMRSRIRMLEQQLGKQPG